MLASRLTHRPILRPPLIPGSLLPLAWMVLAGCADLPRLPALGGGRIDLWAASDAVTIFPNAIPEWENEVFSQAARVIRLDAAVHETVAFQLVLSTPDRHATVRSVDLGGLRGGSATLPVECVRFYRQVRVPLEDYPAWYLRLTPNLRERREFPDVLVPLSAPRGALPIQVEQGRSEALWGEIQVPTGTEAGTYRGSLRLAAAGQAPLEYELVLTVRPFALPLARHLPVLAGLRTRELISGHLELNGRPYAPDRISAEDPLYEKSLAVITATIALLHEHRCAPMPLDLRPLRQVGSDGRWALNWSIYDQLVRGWLDGSAFADRIAVPLWPLPVDGQFPPPQAHNGVGSSAYQAALREHIAQCVAHFEQRGWLDRHFVWFPSSESDRRRQYEWFQWLAVQTEQADRRVRLACPLTPASMEPFGWVHDPFIDLTRSISIWSPPASLADQAELARQRATGKRTWFRPDRPPFAGSLSICAPATDARSLPWMAYRFGCEAMILEAVNDWPAADEAATGVGEGVLIWPGKAYGLEQPVPSIRLKRLLRGLQDYEYLWLLERNRRPAIAARIAEDVCPFGGTQCYGEHLLDGRPNGWAQDPVAWTLARRLMAQELADAIAADESPGRIAGEGNSTARFEQQIEWARLTESVRRVRLDIEGVRLHVTGADPAAPLHMGVQALIHNATSESVTATLTLPEMPGSWSVDGPPASIHALPPGGMIRQWLKLRSPGLMTGPEGFLPITMALQGDDARLAAEPVRVCLLMSQRITRSPVIDGRLDDWPLGTTNVAGDFVLMGTQDVPKTGRASPDRPTQPTLAFVCDDSQYLYIAFNCQDDRIRERLISRSNAVHYDELWPAGEDLVEVLLDPSGRAVDAGQLYHIVVKANGAVITERGAACLAPVARHEPWSAGIVAAIDDRTQPDRWTVEIRIPWTALGPRSPVWGINFARLTARLGEYSCWTGGRRFFYSPAGLGNIRLVNP